MKRREFVERLGIGSAGIVAAATVGRGAVALAAEQHPHNPPTGRAARERDDQLRAMAHNAGARSLYEPR